MLEEIQWGNVAEWAGAIGTVAALIYAGRALRHEVGSRLEDEEQAAWTEARMLTLTASLTNGSSSRGPFTMGEVVAINGGAREVHDVHLLARRGDEIVVDERADLLLPGGRIAEKVDHIWPAEAVPTGRTSTELRWQDLGGRRWHLTPDGVLRREGS